MLPWVFRGQEPLCVGSAHEPLGWVLDLCPLHGGHVGRAQPAPQFTAREARARRRPLAPSATQFIRGLLPVPAAADTGACAHGGWGPALGGQGLLWEAGVGAGPGREGGNHARACRGALWPEASCAVGRPEARGEPSTWPFSPSKMGRPFEGCVCDQKLRPCGTVACFSVVTLGAAWRER